MHNIAQQNKIFEAEKKYKKVLVFNTNSNKLLLGLQVITSLKLMYIIQYILFLMAKKYLQNTQNHLE